MIHHPYKVAKKPSHRTLQYVFLFALLIRLSILPLAIAFGGNFNLLPLSDLESYQDFRGAYVPAISSFTAGLMPYQQLPFAYPPLFLYLLTPFALFSLPPWTMALPLVFFDAAAVIPVFLIASKLMKPRKAVIASIAFAVAPINLYYNDFLWLNTPPMMFFILLAVYAFLLEKHGSAFICLAIATLFKQTALALFPVFAVALLKKSNRMSVARNVALYGAICFLGSLPYIVMIPASYLSSLGFSFLGLGSTVPVFPYFFGAPTSLAWVFGDVAYHFAQPFLLGALLLSMAALCLVIYRTKLVTDKRSVIYVLYALLLSHALFPRGIYKYYLAAITAFGAIFVGSRKTAALFLGLNVLLLVLPRILTPWFVLVLLVFPLIKIYIAKRTSGPLFQRVTDDDSDQAKVLNRNPCSGDFKCFQEKCR